MTLPAVQVEYLKDEDHVKLSTILADDTKDFVIIFDERHFSHSDCVVLGQDLLVDVLKELVQSRAIRVVLERH